MKQAVLPYKSVDAYGRQQIPKDITKKKKKKKKKEEEEEEKKPAPLQGKTEEVIIS